MTFLADPVDVITDGMTCQDKIEILSGLLCDYDNYFYDAQYDDHRPDYFNYDEPGDLDTLMCVALLDRLIIMYRRT